MDKRQALILAKKYKSTVSAMFDTADVYLFGSYSKGTATKDSDIDVAIVVPDFKGNRYAMLPKLWRATTSVSTLIEPVLLDENHWCPLYDEVMRTGIKL